MKATLVAVAAVLAGTASASHHRHEHKNLFARGAFEKKGNDSEVCVPGCTTIYTTITGEGGLYTPPATIKPTPTPSPSTTSKAATTPKETTPATVPTPIAQTCPTPGVYTFPATTIVVTETTTVCAASTTKVPHGTHTIGGVTTVVETATTIVCPYATTKTESGVVTSVIEITTYVCPSAGTYTIAPVTVTVTDTETVCAVPVVTTITPGTYTAPAVVTTIVETDTVIYCPFTEVTPTPTPEAAQPTPEATQPAPAATSSPSTPKGSDTPALGGGDHWALTYTPYTESGECKSAEQVMADITAIKGASFGAVRVYSTDCDTLPNVGAACKAVGIKMIVGIFIGEVGCDNGSPHVSDQIAALKAWAQWDLVELVVIGNEAIFNGFCSVDQLKQLIITVRSELGSTGYTGPCTTTDVVSAWLTEGMSDLCSVIDVVACNAHAYFNGAVLPDAAGAFVAGQLALVEAVCGLSGYVMETGWPSRGNCIGECCPGESQQAAAVSSIQSALGSKAVFFSFHDDPWKQAGACACEQSWGIGHLFGA
ncbi:glycoside hydrolase [Thozetella sp. PMI_491]|nr:glycoside hydrolase [Thozetella sp. PMI_491]